MSAGHVLQSALALSVKTAARPGHVVQPGRADRPQHHRRVGLRPASGIHTTERGERQQRPLRVVGGDQPPTEPCQCTQILCSTIDSVSRFGAVGQRGVDPASSDPIGGLHRPQAASPRFRKAVHRLASGGEHRRSRGSGQGSLATKVYRHRHAGWLRSSVSRRCWRRAERLPARQSETWSSGRNARSRCAHRRTALPFRRGRAGTSPGWCA